MSRRVGTPTAHVARAWAVHGPVALPVHGPGFTTFSPSMVATSQSLWSAQTK